MCFVADYAVRQFLATRLLAVYYRELSRSGECVADTTDSPILTRCSRACKSGDLFGITAGGQEQLCLPSNHHGVLGLQGCNIFGRLLCHRASTF